MMDVVIKIVTWVITSFSGMLGIAKAFTELKKLLEKDVMPDIKTEDKAEEIVKKQELAHHLVVVTGIEAAYNIARGLILALNFALMMHYALKFSQVMRPKREGEQDRTTGQ